MTSAILVEDFESSELPAVVLNLGCTLQPHRKLKHTHTGTTHTHTGTTQETLTHTQTRRHGSAPETLILLPPWDIARVLGFCCAAEIEKDWGGGHEKQEQGLKQRPKEL